MRRGPPFVVLSALAVACAGPPAEPAADLVVEPVASPTTASLRGLSVVDERVAWATGSGGTVLCSDDGGASWRRVPGPFGDRDLRDVAAFDGRTALVMAVDSPARIWRTTDGGSTWELVLDHPGEGVFLDSIAFTDRERGLAWGDPVGGAFLAFATVDGGRSWTPVTGLPAPAAGEAGFAASGRCIAMVGDRIRIATGGGRSRCLGSDDFGRSWHSVDWPMRSGSASAGAFAVHFRDARSGVAVGGDYLEPDDDRGVAVRTTDGGASWSAPTVGPRGYRSAVDCAVPLRLWVAAGPGGVDVSGDGGRTWRAAADTGFHAIAFAPGATRGLAVGAEGRIAVVRAVPRTP